jgi:hypothetical protein
MQFGVRSAATDAPVFVPLPVCMLAGLVSAVEAVRG